MAATTTLLGLLTPTQGTLSGTWGDSVNYGISDYVDIAIAGTLSFAGDGAITLANTTGSSAGNAFTTTTAQYMVIRITGTQTVTKVITGPSYSKLYMVDHAGATSAVTFKAAGQTGVSVAVGEKCFVYYNGTDYVKVASSVVDGVSTIDFGSTGLTPNTATSGAVTVAGTLAVANGGTNASTASITSFNNITGFTATGATGTTSTNLVFSTGPVLTTPTLGVATATSLQGIIGNVTPAAGSFTTLGASSTATLNTLVSSGATLTGGTINGMTVGATTASTGAFTSLTASTTLGVTGLSTLTAGAVVQGLTVGRGLAGVASNTAVGKDAFRDNTTGKDGVAIGNFALRENTSGIANVAIGSLAMISNTTGSYNTAVGNGEDGVIQGALGLNTTGSNNTGVGYQALRSNSTASNNTAVGYQAGYTNITGANLVAIGYQAGYSSNADNSTYVGYFAGQSTTGTRNTFVGVNGVGYLVSSGDYNTILGGFSGNQDSLDIRTLSNYVVLSDGDGARQITMKEGQTLALDSAVPNAGTGITFPASQSASSDANTLDDYEEGTFNPVVKGYTTAGTATYSRQQGHYTKIGNRVFINIDLIYTSGTGTGDLYVDGLVFPTSSSVMIKNYAALTDGIALTAGNYIAGSGSGVSSTQIYIYQSATGTSTQLAVPYDAAGQIIISGQYFVD